MQNMKKFKVEISEDCQGLKNNSGNNETIALKKGEIVKVTLVGDFYMTEDNVLFTREKGKTPEPRGFWRTIPGKYIDKKWVQCRGLLVKAVITSGQSQMALELAYRNLHKFLPLPVRWLITEEGLAKLIAKHHSEIAKRLKED